MLVELQSSLQYRKMRDFLNNDLFIFDLDGTLVDTSPDIINSVQHVLEKLNLPERSPKDIRESIGGGGYAILKRNIPIDSIDQLNSIVEKFKEHYDQNCSEKSYLYPYVLELLQLLKANKKKIALYTFKTKYATNKVLQDYAIEDYFDVVITKDDVNKPKPDPEGVNMILDTLNYHNREKIIMVGDTLFDVQTGINARINTLGVTFGYDPKLVDYEIKADFYIDNYGELLEMFSGKIAKRRLYKDVAIITGAASGIGRKTAITLAENGAYVACLDVDEQGLKETVSFINRMGNRSEYHVVSISDEEKLNKVTKDIFENNGKISILVNCAAIIKYNSIEDCTQEEWNDIFSINSLGYFLCLKSVAPYIKVTGGTIVQVSSSAALSGSVFASPAYIASKASTIGLSKHVATHWAKYNIRCNAICPGLTETPMIQDDQGSYRRGDENIKGVPLGRNAQPEDIASVVLFLVSDDSRYITGQTIHANGGKYMYNT